MKRIALFLIILLAVPSLVFAQETSLFMDSDPGDYIGQGEQWYYNPDTAEFTIAQMWDTNGVWVSLHTDDPSWGWWDLQFTAPAGEDLTVGQYLGATRYPFNEPNEPGLSITGMGRGCNTLTGSFVVNEITFGPGNTVESFWATFEQHCEGGAPALTGEIRVNQGIVTTVKVNFGSMKVMYR